MGRWAEVYFTSPPEKREEAVLELLRELQAETSAKQDHADAVPSEIDPHRKIPSNPVNPFSPSPAESLKAVALVCQACGKANAAEQRFCGSCGAPLVEEAPYPERQDTFPSRSTVTVRRQEISPRFSAESAREDSVSPAEFDKVLYRDDGERRNWLPDAPKLIPEYERSHRYRLYFGVALAALLGYLAYTGWRQTRVWSENSHSLPKPAPAAETQPAPTPSAAARVEAPEANAVPESVAHSQDAAPRQDVRDHSVADSNNDGENKKPVSKAVLKSPLPAQGSVLQESGSQELAGQGRASFLALLRRFFA